MKNTTICIDLIKEVFQIHDVDKHRKVMLRKQPHRYAMIRFFTNLTPCLIRCSALKPTSILLYLAANGSVVINEGKLKRGLDTLIWCV